MSEDPRFAGSERPPKAGQPLAETKMGGDDLLEPPI